ncbi:DNA methyltransferase Dim-2 [Onygenales sp. PD_12]|nr:DNA methyltransferase Dim-2 [Onygenales sp. PD_12]
MGLVDSIDDSGDENVELDASHEQEQTQNSAPSPPLPGQKLDTLVGVSPPPLIFPKSVYRSDEPSQPAAIESEALEELLSNAEERARQTYGQGDSDFISLCLEDFVIYALPGLSPTPHGMISLDQVALKQGRETATYFFDGLVKAPGSESEFEEFYLEKVPFRLVSIGGYEDVEQHSVDKDIWIQSLHNASKSRRGEDVWYQLGAPAPIYKAYHNSFSWLADFAKHFVDYLHNTNKVTLRHFRSDFTSWIKEQHGADPLFTQWLAEYGRLDFRQAVNAHSNFLQKQAWDLGSSYYDHPLWDELGVSQDPIVQEQPQVAKGTIVTPYIYQCFKNMVWANHLNAVDFEPQVLAKHKLRLQELGFIQRPRKVRIKSKHPSIPDAIFKDPIPIAPGDVVAIRRDQQTRWKGTDDLWYAFVQDVRPRKTRASALELIWLYRPSETVCADLTYPQTTELFFSDHCNCRDSTVEATEIVKKVKVSFFSSQAEKGSGFFIRQTYFSEDETFVSLKEDHFSCPCDKRQPKLEYKVGDTVLIEASDPRTREIILEPVEILAMDGSNVEVRLLPRRGRDYHNSTARPNELVYTNSTRHIHIEQVERRCHVRFYAQGEDIPVPYNRDGTGDAFYFTTREILSENGVELLPLQHAPKGFRQGFDPTTNDGSLQKLRALNIFSGGGSFDRGLEEGGAIQNEWAVEWGLAPMLTYRANHEDLEKVNLFWGSVNDFLLQSIQGKAGRALVAKVGDVEFISAGSPCQGYSSVNGQKHNETSMRNSSMIASVASYVDFYRPKYAILENVIAMSNKTHKMNPLCQLTCAFVGMGYQVRILNLDAWSFGAPQSRCRLFILIAAPGLQLPSHPSLTHSHPEKTTERSLGKAPNGLPFGKRHWDIPVFEYLTASEALKDLPGTGTGRITPVSLPDHRQVRVESDTNRHLVNNAPKAPWNSGLREGIARGFISPDLVEQKYSKATVKTSRMWSRIHPYGLMPTVTTFPSPFCKFTGRILHWKEDRVVSVMEARRAQGFPDDEVLVGSPSQQWKVVGNSVARQVALALGLVVREACLRNLKGGREGETGGVGVVNGVTNGVRVVVNNGGERGLSAVSTKQEEGQTESDTDVVNAQLLRDMNMQHGDLPNGIRNGDLKESQLPTHTREKQPQSNSNSRFHPRPDLAVIESEKSTPHHRVQSESDDSSTTTAGSSTKPDDEPSSSRKRTFHASGANQPTAGNWMKKMRVDRENGDKGGREAITID